MFNIHFKDPMRNSVNQYSWSFLYLLIVRSNIYLAHISRTLSQTRKARPTSKKMPHFLLGTQFNFRDHNCIFFTFSMVSSLRVPLSLPGSNENHLSPSTEELRLISVNPHPKLVNRISNASATTPTSPRPMASDLSSGIEGAAGTIVIGYRGTFAFGKDGLSDVKFRKLTRILVHGKVKLLSKFGFSLCVLLFVPFWPYILFTVWSTRDSQERPIKMSVKAIFDFGRKLSFKCTEFLLRSCST